MISAKEAVDTSRKEKRTVHLVHADALADALYDLCSVMRRRSAHLRMPTEFSGHGWSVHLHPSWRDLRSPLEDAQLEDEPTQPYVPMGDTHRAMRREPRMGVLKRARAWAAGRVSKLRGWRARLEALAGIRALAARLYGHGDVSVAVEQNDVDLYVDGERMISWHAYDGDPLVSLERELERRVKTGRP